MPAIYGPLFSACLARAWDACRKHPWTFFAPVLLLAVRAVLVTFVTPLDRVGPLITALATALSWTAYFVVLKRLSFGWRTTLDSTATQLGHRGADIATLVRPALTGVIVFLSLEYAGCFGGLILCATAIGPVVELLALRDVEPHEALGQSLVFLKDRPFVWGALQLALVSAAGMLWLTVTAPLGLALEYLVAPDFAWLSALLGAVVVGPALHFLFVFRGVLFLEVERTTHAQRIFRARMAA